MGNLRAGCGVGEGRGSGLGAAPLLALAATLPFWLEEDTGYASFRTELWGRFPMAGPPQLFASRAEHDALVRALIDTGFIQDSTRIYWDIRLSERFGTTEFRVTDVCSTVDEAVMIAGLARALAQSCHERAARDEPCPPVRSEILRAAHWRAARYGLEGELIDVQRGRSTPAPELVEALLAFVRDVLEERGVREEVESIVRETIRGGNAAARQRAAYRRRGKIQDVVGLIMEETARGVVDA